MCLISQHMANLDVCRGLRFCREFFAPTHGKHHVCHVPNVCRVLVLLAHGKGQVCRVPEFAHTAKPWAHGNPAVSGSEEYRIALVQVLTWHGIHLLIMLIVVLDVLEMIILEGTNMSHQRCHFPNLMVWSPHLERQVCGLFPDFQYS